MRPSPRLEGERKSGPICNTYFVPCPKRQAIVLVAGDKAGTSEKRFYKQLIKKADERFEAHLKRLKGQKRR